MSASGKEADLNVHELESGDEALLAEMIAREVRSKQRDRLRMVQLALRGHEKQEIAELLGVPKSVVETWVYRYRDGGLRALEPRKAPGRKPTLPSERHEEFKSRLVNGISRASPSGVFERVTKNARLWCRRESRLKSR